MSRVAKKPIPLQKGVEVKLTGQHLTVKGSKGSLDFDLHPDVTLQVEGNVINIVVAKKAIQSIAIAGTTRAIVNNMVTGVSTGFEKKLRLVGVGYRAALQGKKLNLSLGFSHPIVYELPAGITAEVPTQTDIILRGADKQLLGQVAAEIRAYRPPEPYKGKGVRYADEVVIIKETKKK
jgi:large subunit ribosomal protein L6